MWQYCKPTSNNSATSSNVSGRKDKLGTLMHWHSKIQQNSELLDNPNSQQVSNINRKQLLMWFKRKSRDNNQSHNFAATACKIASFREGDGIFPPLSLARFYKIIIFTLSGLLKEITKKPKCIKSLKYLSTHFAVLARSDLDQHNEAEHWHS